MSDMDFEQRLQRIEDLLHLPWRRSEFWIVEAEGFGQRRALAYWGPFETARQAREDPLFRPTFGALILETPAPMTAASPSPEKETE